MRNSYPADTPSEAHYVTDTYFAVVSVNQSIDRKLLELKIPEGTTTTDRRNNTLYVMGKDGQPSPRSGVIPLNDLEPVIIIQDSPSRAKWYALAGVTFCIGLAFIYLRRT